ncbi:hypothetical protein CMQ_3902 [Grosmannia clavigera kw1407]|uniref:Swiss Army Knife RNA repair protein HAD domain-containing protein n=1 Tax=Grosmannia clavigera (strain kw1407 / UAMH 11150) TaxID=655863 RepID=F0X8X2_GROCL|nr:uncharacterized protein CMQ_3902 [Grosmannia clavigera kw1407]EFX05833.1 hypothetical protein CMQ_3902 [Grosmannia clavigera kw1407]
MAVSASAAYAAMRATQQALQPVPTNAMGNDSGSGGDKTQEHNDSRTGPDSPYTTTALSRWSLLNRKLPDADSIRSLHIYDFDNTLFKTPLPNPKLWNNPTLGYLSSQDVISTGGWWHDSRILAATGEGMAKEELRAWEGWWNERVVDLVRLTQAQPDALCVLLTGRSESGYSDLIQRMVTSKGLDFDMVALKPVAGPNNERFSSTMAFKQAFLETLMETYADAGEMRIYEDRPRHVTGFRDFLADYNKRRQRRQPIAGEVVPVVDATTTLDPVVEVAEVQHMVNRHNAALRKNGGKGRRGPLSVNKTVFFTGYLVKEADSKRLLSLLGVPPPHQQPGGRRDLRYHANSILICPHACPPHLLSKVGGMGSKMSWEVEATGSIDNSVWAAKVRPVPATATIHTEGPKPVVVLAVARNGRPHQANQIRHWQPVARDKAYVFETTVGEKALLRVEPENGANRRRHHSNNNEGDNTGNGSSSSGEGDGDGDVEGSGEGSADGEGGDSNQTTKSRGSRRKNHSGVGGNSNDRRQQQQQQQRNGPIPTQPAAFSAFGAQSGRGYHFQATTRGGRGGAAARGPGFVAGRGGYRGGPQRGRGGGGGGAGGAGKQLGRAQQQQQQQGNRHFYQSLDDAGGSGGSGGPTQPMVYDDEMGQ